MNRHVFLPACPVADGATPLVGFHLFGTTAEINIPEPVMNRLLCHALIQRLHDRGLPEAVECLSNMVRFYDEPLPAPPVLPQVKSFPARITGCYTEPAYPATED